MLNLARISGGSLTAWFIAGALILGGQAGAMHMLSIPERKLAIPVLSDLPSQFGSWKSLSDQTLDSDVLAYLKPDSYVLRDYGKTGGDGAINLFVAYFKSLQNSYGPHSPSVCLPGSGWLVRSSRTRPLAMPARPEGIPVNEYVLEKNNQKIVVLYWYQNDRHIWADEFKAKFTLLPDLIRYRRSDVSLVRVVAPVTDADEAAKLVETQEFARAIFPSLVSKFKVAE